LALSVARAIVFACFFQAASSAPFLPDKSWGILDNIAFAGLVGAHAIIVAAVGAKFLTAVSSAKPWIALARSVFLASTVEIA